MNPEQILVTGGGGFIGSHVVRTLRERYPEAKVRIMHLPNENLMNLEGVDVERIPGDITNRQDVEKAVDGCDVVFHMAAVYALWLPDMSIMDRVNVDGARLVFEVCREKGVKRLVHTSSFAAYAGQGQDRSCNEESPFVLQHSHYSRTKYESEQLAKQFAAEGLDVVVVNPAAPVGPGDLGPTPTGRLFLDTIQQPVNVIMSTGGNYIDVRDCAMGHVLAMEKGRTGESYILGNENYTMKEVVRKVERIIGRRRPNITLSPKQLRPLAKVSTFVADHITNRAPLLTPSDLRTLEQGLYADASKAKKELGLPSRPLEESIRDAVEWFMDHGYLNRRVERRVRHALG